jgi:hypothetical protein
VFENRVLRRVCGLKKDEVTEERRNLHNEELHDLYSSPTIISTYNEGEEDEMDRAHSTNGGEEERV